VLDFWVRERGSLLRRTRFGKASASETRASHLLADNPLSWSNPALKKSKKTMAMRGVDFKWYDGFFLSMLATSVYPTPPTNSLTNFIQFIILLLNAIP